MVSVVPQKAQLFKGTVRYNLSYGNDNVTDEEILDALDKTCSLDFINEKGGLDFEIEYGGRNLSGGQKQRLTIARAILKKADVLILDDSTSALDYVTESKIRKFVTSGEPDFSAKVIISQRISAVMSCDKILVLEDGKCAGYGSHEELAENCEVYREILLSQTGMLFDKGGKK